MNLEEFVYIEQMEAQIKELKTQCVKLQTELEKSDKGWADCRNKLHTALSQLDKSKQ